MSGGCAPALASEVRPIIDNNDNLQESSVNAQFLASSPGWRSKSGVKNRCVATKSAVRSHGDRPAKTGIDASSLYASIFLKKSLFFPRTIMIVTICNEAA